MACGKQHYHITPCSKGSGGGFGIIIIGLMLIVGFSRQIIAIAETIVYDLMIVLLITLGMSTVTALATFGIVIAVSRKRTKTLPPKQMIKVNSIRVNPVTINPAREIENGQRETLINGVPLSQYKNPSNR